MGITFSSAITPILDSHPDLVDVVEIEPQTMWLATGRDGATLRRLADVDAYLRDLPFRKLVHSIGVPVGGTARHEACQIEMLRETIEELGSPWVSEHLSFNSTESFETGFLLPPRQTGDGVRAAVDSIRRLRDQVGVPVAVETGVNYLTSRADEIDDGAFVAAVTEQSDCGILLDLHNVHTNAVNGRQSIDDFIARLPLERVWEIHLAGGFWMDGYWLDAHSGPIPTSLIDRAREIVTLLPNVGAIIFEIYPSFVESVGVDEICRQLELLRELWSLRGCRADRPGEARTHIPETNAHAASPSAWEAELGSLVIGRTPSSAFGTKLASDGGTDLLQKLALEFRASMIATNLPRTTRLMILALGEVVFRRILSKYRDCVTPQMFGGREARAFACFVQDLAIGVPQLAEVVEFELAVLDTLHDETTRVVRFEFDPLPMLLALGDGRLPDLPSRSGPFEIEITPGVASSIGHRTC